MQPQKRAKVKAASANERFVSLEAIKAVKATLAQKQAHNHVITEDIATFDQIML